MKINMKERAETITAILGESLDNNPTGVTASLLEFAKSEVKLDREFLAKQIEALGFDITTSPVYQILEIIREGQDEQ